MKFERRDSLGKQGVNLVDLNVRSIEWPSVMPGSVTLACGWTKHFKDYLALSFRV